MCKVSGDQTYMPVDTRTSVPTHRRFSRIINTNSQHIGGAVFFQIFGEIVAEANKTIRPSPQKVAIYPNIAVHVNSINLYNNLFCGVRSCKIFSIPSDAVREITSGT